MANPGVGNRFASVNLNKSYGHPGQSGSSGGSHYGLGRGRGNGSGGGGGGMVVLSRPRSAHKVGGPKLSVPAPVNLPSLRKEHERFDSLGAGSGGGGGGAVGGGARPSSAGVGWSKPSLVDGVVESEGGVDRGVEGVGKGGGNGSAYLPPSARVGDVAAVGLAVEKASVLRGEDFPSLKATLNAGNGQAQKQKDFGSQKQKQGMGEEASAIGTQSSAQVGMRPQVYSPQVSVGNGVGLSGSDKYNSASFRPQEQGRKQDDYFPGPLPLVRLNPRSDWADDERDTSHGLSDRGRDHGYSRSEAYWDRDFDFPRSSFLPHKPAPNHFDRRGQRDNDVGKGLSNEVLNADPFRRDAGAPSREGREGHTWRAPVSREGSSSQQVVSDRNSLSARPVSVNRDTNKENKYSPPLVGGSTRDEHNNGGFTANRDFAIGRRDQGYGQSGRQQWNNLVDTNSGRGAERNIRDRYGSESNRYRADAVQSNMGSRPSFSAGDKGFSGNDHLQNFGRDKRSFSRSEKPYVEDPFLGSTGFDGQDPFPGSILGVVKRKKDTNKQLDFHDPVRESFEAELERVQKLQEQERQRAIEEQERAMDMARREEEERLRRVREQEEHQRRLEEEAREAVWREEQQRLESIRKAEEQRIAREEEKQRLLLEEERRKQAAKQKLLELEEKIARRQAVSGKPDSSDAIASSWEDSERMPAVFKERDVSRADDFGSWEDGERMVERITNSASSDSSLSRPFDIGSRAGSVRDGSFAFTDRGKPFESWRRDVFDNGNSSSFFSADQENGYQSSRRDAAVGGRSFPRKDLYGGAGYVPTRGHYRGGIPEPHMDDFPHARGHRWNISGDGDPYGRNTELEAEFHDNVTDKFDLAWGQGQSQGRGRGYSPFPERLYQNSDLDELYTYGRSRYPARQPRVLPPPLLTSAHRPSVRSENDHPGPSPYENESIHFNHPLQVESTAGNYQNAQEEHFDRLDVQVQNTKNVERDPNRRSTPGCDSQSSLSVSSPPSSPTHLSHDDFDESRELLAVSGLGEGQDISNSENEDVLINAKAGPGNTITTVSSISVDDDEEWTVENNDESQEQEEYDEDVGYHEEDEVHEGENENVELAREFEDMHLEGKGSDMMDNLVLGFDQGVEVGIPIDDYEKGQNVKENLFAGPQGNVGVMDQKESFDSSRDAQNPKASLQHVSADSSCVTTDETEKTVQERVSEPTDAAHMSVSKESLGAGDFSSSTCTAVHAQPSRSFPHDTNSQSSSQAVPSVAGAQGPAELPVKLQFGLFSGPSLIPSPVPAIQIGSIQMPLQLHPHIGPPLTHMHAPQPPLFQFGQLRYPSPMSQGILPLAPQSMSFLQPNVPANYPSSQALGRPVSVQPVQDSSSHSSVTNDVLPLTITGQHSHPANQLSVRQEIVSKKVELQASSSGGSKVIMRQNQADASSSSVNQGRPEVGRQADNVAIPRNVMRNSRLSSNNRASDSRPRGGPSSSHSSANQTNSSGPAAQHFSGSRGRRSALSARNPGPRLSSMANEATSSDINGYQRRPRRVTQRYEFRVRQTADVKESSSSPSFSNSAVDAKSNNDAKRSGMLPKGGLNNSLQPDKPKHAVHSCSDQIRPQETSPVIEEGKPAAATSVLDTSRRAEGSLKRNISPEDDVDAPLQSGIVRIYKQPGIEAPSDDDDFIEVRSKRQMLNDRREQREKEIKAKSSNLRKPQRKSRPVPQGTTATRSTSRTSASSVAQATKSIRAAVTPRQGLLHSEVSAPLNNVVSHTLSPIGTPPVNADRQTDARAQSIKPPQTGLYSTSGQTVGPDGSNLTFDAQSKVDRVDSSVGPWGSSQTNQPVMTLTQTQLEEAMKPACFDTHLVSVGDHNSSIGEPGMPTASIPAKDIAFSSATSPISSLLAGEKIQFGAVTSPAVVPSGPLVSQGSRPSAPSSVDIHMSQSMPVSGNNCDTLFGNEKHSNESSRPLEDCEAEAEAAASAVAVAAIGNDEVVGNNVASCTTAISDTKGFGGVAINGITGGMSRDQLAGSQSKAEETLSVSLPADLSVETPPISMWPPLPSPHNSSSQMISPFPGGPTSHFPFYDMNPMMGGPVFAFGPNEESTGAQSQLQKSNAPSSGPLGTWQQCHTGVDSFYGPPAGFTTPFITPPGSIPGVQGPPHMVVYNHFAPVGQFGQVGLSYMGTTYIPSGKQPDWKRNSTSSGEGEMNCMNMVPVQRNAPNVPAQVQHLAPGSPLLSMASPMAMFEVPPFQPTSDVSVHPRWSHVQASSVQTIAQSLPLQQQVEIAVPSQFSHGSSDHQLSGNGFSKPQSSLPLEDSRSFPAGTNAAVTQFPDELGLVNSPRSTAPEAPALSKNRPGNPTRVDSVAEGTGSKRNSQVAGTGSHSHRGQAVQQKNASVQQHYNNHYQRGGAQKMASGAEWPNRKMGFHGRNHSSGGERNFPPTKVKQIYVAKQSTGGTSAL